MSNVSRALLVRSLVLCLFAALAAPAVRAQATSGNPALDKHLARLDLGVSGIGAFTKDVSGTNTFGVKLTQNTSNTFGALGTIRYTKSPWIGGEFNFAYARYTQNFSNYIVGGAQTNATEYSLGYVAHPPHLILGAQPFIAGGAGSTAFRPSRLRIFAALAVAGWVVAAVAASAGQTADFGEACWPSAPRSRSVV